MLSITSPLNIHGRRVNNRLIVPPMASQTADSNGFVTENTLSHYDQLSSSQAGIIYVEYSYVSIEGKSEENQLAIDSFDKIIGLKLLANRIKSHGALAGIQLTHAGGKTESHITKSKLIAPSNIAIPVKGKSLETPEGASLEEIKRIKEDFIQACKLAILSGFDIIELHSAHGYGLNQWLSPLTNKRTDEYGGNLFNRGRILFEIIYEIRKKFPDIILSVRVPGQDHLEGGLTISDSILLCEKLKDLGVNILNVSSGIGGWKRPRARSGEGYLVADARSIQQKIDLPVIGVGGILTKNYINKELNDGSFSLAAVGRSILSNPHNGRELLSS